MKSNKRTISGRIDAEIFEKGTHIIQNILHQTYSKFIEDSLKKLIRTYRK